MVLQVLGSGPVGEVLAGWNFNDHATLLFGYRHIAVDYNDGSGSSRILGDVGLGGPTVALAWRF